ncbi:unnamed protein product, partial [Candidula unifasciata]
MTDTPTAQTITIPLFTPKVCIRRRSTYVTEQPKRRRAFSLQRKSCVHPWANREDPSDAYELPASQREIWWRKEVKVTPIPGAYDEIDFIQELVKKPNTYNFKALSRNQCKGHAGTGTYLMPGSYEYQDFLQILSKKPATYSFKTSERFAQDVLNFGLKDKYIDVPPNAYSTQNYLAIDGEKCPVKNSMFRSQSRRFSYLLGNKNVPSPATYTVKDPYAVAPAITSFYTKKNLMHFPTGEELY